VARVFEHEVHRAAVGGVRGDNLADARTNKRARWGGGACRAGISDIGSRIQTGLSGGPVETVRRAGRARRCHVTHGRADDAEASSENINTPSVWIDPNKGSPTTFVT